jgi:hypothetical protein
MVFLIPSTDKHQDVPMVSRVLLVGFVRAPLDLLHHAAPPWHAEDNMAKPYSNVKERKEKAEPTNCKGRYPAPAVWQASPFHDLYAEKDRPSYEHCRKEDEE